MFVCDQCRSACDPPFGVVRDIRVSCPRIYSLLSQAFCTAHRMLGKGRESHLQAFFENHRFAAAREDRAQKKCRTRQSTCRMLTLPTTHHQRSTSRTSVEPPQPRLFPPALDARRRNWARAIWGLVSATPVRGRDGGGGWPTSKGGKRGESLSRHGRRTCFGAPAGARRDGRGCLGAAQRCRDAEGGMELCPCWSWVVAG